MSNAQDPRRDRKICNILFSGRLNWIGYKWLRCKCSRNQGRVGFGANEVEIDKRVSLDCCRPRMCEPMQYLFNEVSMLYNTEDKSSSTCRRHSYTTAIGKVDQDENDKCVRTKKRHKNSPTSSLWTTTLNRFPNAFP